MPIGISTCHASCFDLQCFWSSNDSRCTSSLTFQLLGLISSQSFNQMSADYDKVIGFFEFTQRFLDRLSLIEGHSPEQAPFQRCITRVFSSMLTICAVAQEYAKEKRFSGYLWRGCALDLLNGY